LQVWGSDETENSIEYGWDLFYSSNSNGENTKTWVYTPFPASVTQSTLNVSSLLDYAKNDYAPWPVALNLEKTSVDVTNADQNVKVYLQIANDDIPVQYSISVQFIEQDVEGSGIYANNFKLISGSVANGIYEGTIQVPRYKKNGNYNLSGIYISEYIGSSDLKQYSRSGDSIPAELRKSIIVTGTQDVTAPVLENISISPSTVDTRNGTAVVLANLTVSDDLSGLNESILGSEMVLISPSGKEFLWKKIMPADRISGSSTNGTYQVQFELPQYSEEGAWTIDYIELVDRNYNTRFLIPANLTAQQIAASTIQVQGWPRTWEVVSDITNSLYGPKAIITKDKARFWFPIADIDGSWTWGQGSDNSLEYMWSVESPSTSEYSFSVSRWESPGSSSQITNFENFLSNTQTNVWRSNSETSSSSVVEGAQITSSRDGQSLLIELTDPVYLSKLQKEMPSYLALSSSGSMQDDYQQNVKVEYVKEDVQLSVGNLTHIADGTDKIPTVTSTPGNHTQDVTITYNGTTSPPSEPGTYTVVAHLNEANYKGRQVATMTISNPPPSPPGPAQGGGAPSGGGGGGGGGGEAEKPKKGKNKSDKNDSGDKKSSSKKSDKKDNSDKKSAGKKSDKKSSSGDSKKSGGKNSRKK
jgi:hypothetical protein